MAWHKAKDGRWNTYVYHPGLKRKVYVGRRALEREARALFREKTEEFAKAAGKAEASSMTVAEYAQEWLEHHHGPGTKRPAATTGQVNRTNLAPFLKEFGERALDGGIGRKEALRWAKLHGHNAKSVSAMFNDAIDDESCKSNPFANRRHEQPRERKDISPLTEVEVSVLADIALRHWGRTDDNGYGWTARAWILFAAWVGCRPGETFSVELRHLNFDEGVATIKRVKKRGKVYPTDRVALPMPARQAINDIPVLQREGPLFRTVLGRRMKKGALRYHWSPIRDAFREACGEERWAELTFGQRTLDFYALRHFCASVMVDRGANEYEVSEQLGNSPEVCRETYIHVHKQRVLDRNRLLLERPAVVDLTAERERRIK